MQDWFKELSFTKVVIIVIGLCVVGGVLSGFFGG